MYEKNFLEFEKNGWTVVRNFFLKKEVEEYEIKIQNFLTKKLIRILGEI